MQELSCYELQIQFTEPGSFTQRERIPFTSTSDEQAIEDAKEGMKNDYLPYLKIIKYRVCTLDIGKLADHVQRNSRVLHEYETPQLTP